MYIHTHTHIYYYQIEKNEMDGACSTYDRSGTHRVLVGKPGGMRPLGRQRRRWENDIKMDLQDWDGGSWNGFIWLRRGSGGGHF